MDEKALEVLKHILGELGEIKELLVSIEEAQWEYEEEGEEEEVEKAA